MYLLRSSARAQRVLWHFDETYIKVKGQWVYLYRAVTEQGDTIDFYLAFSIGPSVVAEMIASAEQSLQLAA
jgi:hypothetical protein